MPTARPFTIPAGTQVALTLDGSTTFQTIEGLGVNINSGAWDSGAFAPYLTKAVQEMGASRFRVVVEEASALEPSNDDADPATFDWTDYDATFSTTQFQNLWSTIAHLNSLGISGGITLSIMGQAPAFMGQPLTTTTAIKNEWAEMVAALANYGLVRRNPPVTFGAFSPNNEADWDIYEGSQMSAATYADCLGRLADKLTALGLSSLKLAGPDTASLSEVNNYVSAFVGDSDVMSRITHVTGHNYSGSTSGMTTAAATASRPWGMSELGNFDQAFSALGDGASIVELWEYSDSIYNHAIRRGDGSAPPNDQLPGFPAPISFNGTTYGIRDSFYEFCHLCRWTRPGAIRIATSAGGSIATLAFKRNGGPLVTVVGKNTGGAVVLAGTISNIVGVIGLQVYVTTSSQKVVRQADVPIIGNQFWVAIPASSIFTLTSGG